MKMLFLVGLFWSASFLWANDKIYIETYDTFLIDKKERKNNPATIFSADAFSKCYSGYFKNNYSEFKKSKDVDRAKAWSVCHDEIYFKSQQEKFDTFGAGWVDFTSYFLKHVGLEVDNLSNAQTAQRAFTNAISMNPKFNFMTKYEYYYMGCWMAQQLLIMDFEKDKAKKAILDKYHPFSNREWCSWSDNKPERSILIEKANVDATKAKTDDENKKKNEKKESLNKKAKEMYE